MRGVPAAIVDVHHARNSGWPKSRETHGDGVPRGVSERESRLQGEGGEAGECPANETRDKRHTVEEGLIQQETGKDTVRYLHPQATGAPDAGKLACPVRRGQLETCRKVTRWLPTRLGRRVGKLVGFISSVVAPALQAR